VRDGNWLTPRCWVDRAVGRASPLLCAVSAALCKMHVYTISRRRPSKASIRINFDVFRSRPPSGSSNKSSSRSERCALYLLSLLVSALFEHCYVQERRELVQSVAALRQDVTTKETSLKRCERLLTEADREKERLVAETRRLKRGDGRTRPTSQVTAPVNRSRSELDVNNAATGSVPVGGRLLV
jgi:hypothetical protein